MNEVRCSVARSLPGRESHVLLVIMLSLTVLYLLLPIALGSYRLPSSPSDPVSFWSPDSGARFAMIQSWLNHGQLVHPFYPSADLDPSGELHPLSYYLLHQSNGFYTMYPPLFPFVSGLFYYTFGVGALTVVPAFSGLGTLLTTYATARRLGLRSRLLLLLVLGLATPLCLYSSVFWDHSAIMLITALAGYWMMRSLQDDTLNNPLILGAVMGLGMWLHELSLALFIAVWLSSIPLSRMRRHIMPGITSGFFSVVLLWGIFNWSVYGIVLGPHLGANVLQNSPDHRFDLASILDLSALVERAMIQLTGTTAFAGRNGLFWWFILFAGLLAVYALIAWSSARVRGVAPLLGLAIGALALILSLKGYAGTNNGLFQATPVLIPALAVPWRIHEARVPFSPSSLFYSWTGRTCFLFVLFVLINPMLPGVDWGSRYLLTVLPLLVLTAAHALEQQYQETVGIKHGCVIASAAGLIAISLISQCDGFFFIRRSLTYSQQLNKYVRAITANVLVTDSLSVGPVITTLPASQTRFMVRSDDDEKLLATVLRRMKANDFVYLSTLSHADELESYISHSNYVFVQVDRHPLWKVRVNQEEGPEVTVVRFVLKKE